MIILQPCSKKSGLNYSPLIRRFLAGLMLLLFAFSNTPKKTLHDFFAHHKDIPVRSSGAKYAQFSQSGFNCKCDDLVVEAPYIGSPHIAEPVAPPAQRPVFRSSYQEGFIALAVLVFGLRGPPAV